MHAGVVMYKGKVAVPPAYRREMLHRVHLFVGHGGRRKTIKACETCMQWPGMREEAECWATTCHWCQRYKARHTKLHSPLTPIDVPRKRWSVVGLDFIHLPKSYDGSQRALVIVDLFTKYTLLEPMPYPTKAIYVAVVVYKRVCVPFGTPERIISDRGPEFVGNVWGAMAAIVGFRNAPTVSYHPQANGQVERTNSTVKSMLYLLGTQNPTSWPAVLPQVEAAYNRSYHTAINTSPAFLLLGYEPVHPLPSPIASETMDNTLVTHRFAAWAELLRHANETAATVNQARKASMARAVNKRRRTTKFFVEGQWVLCEVPPSRRANLSFRPRWDGP